MSLHFKKIGKGYPLLLLHGLFGSSDNMLGAARHLFDRYEVFLPDLRNHGRSPHHSTMSYEALADDIDVFFSENNIGEAIILGHSMGGKTAMQFALDNPQKVSKLIVVDMGIKAYPLRHIQYIKAMMSVDFDAITSRHDAEEYLSKDISDPKVVQLLLKNIEWKTDKRLGWRINLEALYDNVDSILAALTPVGSFAKPSLFLKGEWSDYIISSDIEGIRKVFPAMSLVTIPEAGHWTHADNPAAFLGAVDAFLAE